MSIQQSINQTLTGATFLLSQTPLAESARTKSRLKVEERENIAKGQRIVERAKKARDAGLAAADKTLEEAKKEHEDATLATAGMSEDDDIMKVADTSRARYIEKSKLAEGQILRSLEDYADTVYGAYGQEEEYAKARQAALSKRGKMQGDYTVDMQSALQKKMEEETRARMNTEEVRKRILEETYRKGERI